MIKGFFFNTVVCVEVTCWVLKEHKEECLPGKIFHLYAFLTYANLNSVHLNIATF